MKKTLSIAALVLASLNAHAGTTDFDVVNGIDDPGLNVLLTVRQSVFEDYAYDFVITNLSNTGNITGVYFERDWTRKLKGVGTPSGPATYYAASLTPDIVGWLGPMGSHKVWHNTVEHMLHRGVFTYTHHNVIEDGLAPGQSQVFSFVTDTNIISLENLENALATEGYNVAVQVQGIYAEGEEEPSWMMANAIPAGGGGGGGGFTPTAAPTPTAATAAAALCLGTLIRRRRRA